MAPMDPFKPLSPFGSGDAGGGQCQLHACMFIMFRGARRLVIMLRVARCLVIMLHVARCLFMMLHVAC